MFVNFRGGGRLISVQLIAFVVFSSVSFSWAELGCVEMTVVVLWSVGLS